MRRFILPQAVVAASLSVALLVAAGPVAAQAQLARTITNVATIAWERGAERFSRASNRVDITVEPEAAARASATFFRLDRGAATQASLGGTRCGTAAGGAPIAMGPAWAGIALDSATIVETRSLRAGEPMIVMIDRAAANRDPQAADTLTVRLKTDNGDAETLTLVETEANIGRFAGAVPTAAGGAPVPDDCRITLRPGQAVAVEIADSETGVVIAGATADVLIDPFGIAFDSATGAPVSGVRISLVDADSGRPADVFGDDGVSPYPSSVVTGETVTDAGGQRYAFPPGDYRFPLTRPGRYRLRIGPPGPYTAPSVRTPAQLADFRRPDGATFTIVDGSFGGIIVLDDPAPVRVDIPLDAPPSALTLTKTASRAIVEPGDVVQYRVRVGGRDARATGIVSVTDLFPPGFRLRANSVRLDGRAIMPAAGGDGRGFSITVPSIPAGRIAELSYTADVLGDAREGDAINRVEAFSGEGPRAVADAAVRVTREVIAGRMTITGRVTDGGCAIDPRAAIGIRGVRIMLEDGSYAVTDIDGRYHFEGVVPGIHVVQMDDSTLPAGRAAIDCARDTRSAGRAFSRFVEGTGGALKRVDFHAAAAASRPVQARPDAARAAPARPRPAIASDAAAAGADADWTSGGAPTIAWLFPGTDYNPRARVSRVAIRHLPGQTVALTANGRAVDPMTSDGTAKSPDGRYAVARWRGIPLDGAETRLIATVRDANGALAQTLTRTISFSGAAMQVRLVPELSAPIADGVTRPVIAVRLTDRDGRPVRHGAVGPFTLPAPYLPAVEADAQQARQLSGLERAQPFWRVDGDDGIAYIALEPTTASGSVGVDFALSDGDVRRQQRVDAWLDAGDRPWTIVGFAAGTAGFNSLAGNLESLGRDAGKLDADGRIALYAKGRVRGRWLLTVAYDSDKRADASRFAGTIDPQAYYTVYADASERRYDASSLRKLYLKLERPQFAALFGDFDTGLGETELTRYQRSLNGARAAYLGPRLAATAFAADTPFTHRRDEIQGNGLTGPYALHARDILANSEQISVETRDRFRSNIVVETRRLTRHIDYDIDYQAGTLRFREPILSRSSGLDPQIIVADYEVDGVAGRVLNAGGRIAYRNAADTVRIGATAVRDKSETGSTVLGGADVRYRPTPASEVRAEIAASERGSDVSTSWLVEAEHHGSRTDVLAYAREQHSGFGVGQTNRAEDAARKIGIDGRVRVTNALSLSASGWHEEYLDRDARRIAGRALIEYRGRALDLRGGIIVADDRLADGRTAGSTLIQLGASKRLLGNRLEIDGSTEFAIARRDDSIDFPARHKLGARFAVTPEVALLAAYEIADGDAIDARTLRVGFDLKPWAGARFALTGNRQELSEYGPRSFAGYGLSQSLPVGKDWTIDLTVDGNKTVGRVDPERILNPLQPIASGGYIGDGSSITEDFTALTAGATYRGARWSATGRAEYRAGSLGDRYGITAAALRQVGEGSAAGIAVNWNDARADGGPRTRTAGVALSWARRPVDSRWSWLEKLELRDDRVVDAVRGLSGPIGGAALLIDGNARSRRIVSSLSVNWSPVRDRGGWLDAAEVSLFWGTRYASERIAADDVRGWSNIVGGDVRFDLSDVIDIGASASVGHNAGALAVSYSAGPNVGVTPFANGWLSAGYNVVGFHDRDFAEARYTRNGPYMTLRVKFDQLTLRDLSPRRDAR